MSNARTFALTALTMVAFASNSLLCRVALKQTGIDPVSFTTVRVISGAIVLWLLARMRGTVASFPGNWPSAVALYIYAIAFSLAYVSLPAATGALLLFGAVQATMIGYGLYTGERFSGIQFTGLLLAIGGLGGLLLPGVTAPPLVGGLLMIAAGAAWGIYSLRGRGVGDPIQVTAGNFVRAAPIALILSWISFRNDVLSGGGFWYAVASGAVTSGMGYALWYTVLPRLRATVAATVQLSVPPIAAAGAILFLREPFTLRLAVASLAILGGIALFVTGKGAVMTPSVEASERS